MTRIPTDWFMAAGVYDRLIERYLAKGQPYNRPDVILPQAIVPENMSEGSREHALFLFCSCYYMSGGIESDIAFKSLAEMYEAWPEMFDPVHIVEKNVGPEEVTSILAGSKLNYGSVKNGEFWVENFKHLYRHWGGDPRNLLLETASYDELCRNIRNKGRADRMEDKYAGMLGFQHKMVSMLAYFLTDTGIVKLPYVYPIPVDFHVMRVNLEHGIVAVRGRKKILRSKELLQRLRDLSVWYCQLRGIPSNVLCDALWLLSKYACRHNPGNSYGVKKNGRKGRNGKPYQGRRRRVIKKKVDWTSAQVRTYHQTCGVCPVEGTCQLQIPSAYYYVRGHIQAEGLRAKPPQRHLFPLYDAHSFIPQIGKSGKKNGVVTVQPKMAALPPEQQLHLLRRRQARGR